VTKDTPVKIATEDTPVKITPEKVRLDGMQSALVEIGALILVKSSYTETELRILDVLRRVEPHLDLSEPLVAVPPAKFGVWVTPSEADAQNCQPTWAQASIDSAPAAAQGRWVRAEFASFDAAWSFAKLGYVVGRPNWTYVVREITDDSPAQP
jgi:hypothetical protein